jgi:sialate O-acetylesterase
MYPVRRTALLLLLTTVPMALRAQPRTTHADAHADAHADSLLRLPSLFRTGMVLQRETPVAVWGWTQSGAQVGVDWRGRRARATADAGGRWRATLPATTAGGPFTLVVTSGAQRIELHDVLVGDVWLAGGQSNMEFTLSRATGGADEAAGAHDAALRHFKVPIAWADHPQDDVPGGEWQPATPAHAGDFSAVAYFFARQLRDSLHVPIGIIGSNWGGSAIETWLSRRASGLSDSAWQAIAHADQVRTDSVRQRIRARLGALPAVDPGLTDHGAPWAAASLDDAGWSSIAVPAYWEPQGYEGMDGVGWYRLAFDVSEGERASGATLALDAVDDDDLTWVNGVEIGRTAGYNIARRYRIPAEALHAGRNVLTVRVTDAGGGGGINGPVAIAFGTGATRSLAGTWKFRVGMVSFTPDPQRINKLPSVAYNGMIAPILPYAIKGVIWYQGESNANDLRQAAAYRAQFATLIGSWRQEWHHGSPPMPFLWAQLPNYGAVDSVPPLESAWAAQRESMEAALALPATGRAVTIDVGEANDIHPRDKRTVGDRLARVALARVYGRHVVASGPTYRAHRAHGGGRLAVAFDHADGGLVSHAPDGRIVQGFAVAGADRKFVWATARIVGDSVEVWSDAVTNPVALRYAWANNPRGATLYNGAGLPAAPFRTDRW